MGTSSGCKYGVWSSTQTVFLMLSHPTQRDHYRVLSILKSRTLKNLPDAVTVSYAAPQDFFGIDTIDTLKESDSVIAGYKSKTKRRGKQNLQGFAPIDQPLEL